MEVLDTEFIIKITKIDAEALALVTKNELIKYKDKSERVGRLIELNKRFSELAGVEPADV